ncbi:MAG TPA: hypothetical protein VEC76_20160 [Streptosporangiaceae bacterium]|nr:hypothetical protein [Streptosporangiaceae bacterium]
MTPVNSDFDEMLRRALHAEADFLEPAEGGLDRIRQRTHAPWLVRQTSLMLTECADLARLIVIRLEPGFTSARATIAARGGMWEAFVALLSSVVSVLADLILPSRRRGPARQGEPSTRTRPGRSPHAKTRSGSGLGWLRPALAVAGAVVIVVAGVFGLAQVRDNLVLELFPSSNPASSTGTGGSSTGHQTPTLTGQTPTGIVPPATGPSDSAKPSPKATCSSSPSKQQATATPTPSVSTSPTPTVSSTPTITPTPTVTPTPTDTTGGSQTSAYTTGAPGIQTVANVTYAATQCGSASPHNTASSS